MTQVTVADVCLLRSCHTTTVSTVVTSNDPADRISRIDSESRQFTPPAHAKVILTGAVRASRAPAREESAGPKEIFTRPANLHRDRCQREGSRPSGAERRFLRWMLDRHAPS